MTCTETSDEELLSYLLQHGLAQYKNEHGDTALHIACESRNLAVATLLLQQGADIHAVGCNQETPLFRSCWHCFSMGARGDSFPSADDYQFLTFLQTCGAKFDVVNAQGKTILHMLLLPAIFSDKLNPSFIEWLLQNGVPLNAQDNTDSTFAHNAFSQFPHIGTEIVRMICVNCDVTIPDNEGKLPFERIIYSYSGNHSEQKLIKEKLGIILVLLRQKFPSYLPKNSADLLLFAVHIEHCEFIEELFQRGLDFNVDLQKRILPVLTTNTLDLLIQHGMDISYIALQPVITSFSLDLLLIQKLVTKGVAVTVEDITRLISQGTRLASTEQQQVFIATCDLLLSKLMAEADKNKILSFLLNSHFLVTSGWLGIFLEFILDVIIESPSPQLTVPELAVLTDALVNYKRYESIEQLSVHVKTIL